MLCAEAKAPPQGRMEANAITAIKSCFKYLSYVLGPAKACTCLVCRIGTG